MQRERIGWGQARESWARPLRVGEAEAHEEQCGAGPGEGREREVNEDKDGPATRGPCERAFDVRACRRGGAQTPEQDGQRYARRRGRGVGMLTGSRAGASRTTTTAATILAVMWTLAGHFSSFGPLAVRGQEVFNPSWEWLGQDLYECAVAEEGRETRCKCYTFDPNAVVPCSTERPEVPEARTEQGVQKSCTHDPKVQYSCNPDDPVCT